MRGKICDECRESFEPSRGSQRFCSTRCANRQRDRRRRHHNTPARSAPCPVVQDVTVATPSPERIRSQSSAALTAALADSYRFLDSLGTQLRSQSGDVEHLEAEIADQRAVIKSLRADVVRLHTAQQTDAQDLFHLGGKLLAFSRAAQMELDNTTKKLFRRRGWTSARNQDSQNP